MKGHCMGIVGRATWAPLSLNRSHQGRAWMTELPHFELDYGERVKAVMSLCGFWCPVHVCRLSPDNEARIYCIIAHANNTTWLMRNTCPRPKGRNTQLGVISDWSLYRGHTCPQNACLVANPWRMGVFSGLSASGGASTGVLGPKLSIDCAECSMTAVASVPPTLKSLSNPVFSHGFGIKRAYTFL